MITCRLASKTSDFTAQPKRDNRPYVVIREDELYKGGLLRAAHCTAILSLEERSERKV
jgi:hypothetical protein